MGLPKSTPETEQEHLRALGPKVGPIYHGLYIEMLWVHAKWLEYRKLFANSDSRIQLLNTAAPFFFYVVQEVLWDDVLLHIARLTDPPKQRTGFENLSLRCLAQAVPDPKLADDLGQLVDAAESAASFARSWRNKHLAHRDRTVALELDRRRCPA